MKNIIRVESISEAEYEANARRLHRSKWEYYNTVEQLQKVKSKPKMTYFIHHRVDPREINLWLNQM